MNCCGQTFQTGPNRPVQLSQTDPNWLTLIPDVLREPLRNLLWSHSILQYVISSIGRCGTVGVTLSERYVYYHISTSVVYRLVG